MSSRSFLCLLALAFGCLRLPAIANNDIFPPAPPARDAINWKDGYFLINGKPTFITSGEMHYARIPRELWRDRIWRAKEMGLNCIQTYVFWNASEPKEGKWDFSDNLDLDAWLTTIQQAGLYAVVRVGPYCCAEWDQGGFPAWLTVKPGMTLRDSGALYDSLAYPHLDQVEKIVAKHQINHGGNVIMVQLENEHPWGWGTDDKNPYLAQLVKQARDNGLEVPVFLSGLHHGNDPAGDQPFPASNSPWYSTEFWSGWIGKYGDMDPGMLAQKVAGTWKIIAFGGAGYDYYVVHGGTNFGYSGFNHEATYDYAAPIGEAGGFNNFYAPAKRAAYFARSFSDLLTGSHNDPGFATTDSPAVRVTTRTSPTQGSLIMLDRFEKKSAGGQIAPAAGAYESPRPQNADALMVLVSTHGRTLPGRVAVRVGTLEPSTILADVPWTAHATFALVCTNVLLRTTVGAIDYWVCYGEPGDMGRITLKRGDQLSAPITFSYPKDDTVREYDLDSGDQRHATLLVMNKALTARTWLVDGKIVVGPRFVREDGGLEFSMEGGAATVYSARGESHFTQASEREPQVPTLSDWSWRDAAPERTSALEQSLWQATTSPQPIGAIDSYQNRYAWYRTTIHASTAATVALQFADRPDENVAFLNGAAASLDKLKLQAGDNTLAILAKAQPRETLYNQAGPIKDQLKRGVWGDVTITPPGAATFSGGWFFHGGLADLDESAILGRVRNWNDFLAARPWQKANEASPGSPAFWKSTFTYHADPLRRMTCGLTTDSLKAGNVWLNGHNLGESPQKHLLYLPECWLTDGENEVVIFDLYGAAPDKIQIETYEASSLLKTTAAK